jgi:ABC-type cobalamin/Fe3+-siderophores transport system ATPase subunit
MQTSLESQQVLYTTPQLLIQVEHLSRIIMVRSRKTVILDDVTFTVPGGSLFAINGPSGSGKSTLLNMLTEGGDVVLRVGEAMKRCVRRFTFEAWCHVS